MRISPHGNIYISYILWSEIFCPPSRTKFRDPASRFRLLAKHRSGSRKAKNRSHDFCLCGPTRIRTSISGFGVRYSAIELWARARKNMGMIPHSHTFRTRSPKALLLGPSKSDHESISHGHRVRPHKATLWTLSLESEKFSRSFKSLHYRAIFRK